MSTKRQEELVDSFLSELGDEVKPLYREIIKCLSDLGYQPRKERSYILFMHRLHKRQIAKMGLGWTKDNAPYFALRFSGCEGYSQRFAEIVRDNINKNLDRLFPHCGDGKCVFSADTPPAYRYAFPDGETKSLCGAKALVIPDIAAGDIEEIKRLIGEEHTYLVLHEEGIAAT